MNDKKTILMLLVLVTGLTLQQSAKAQEAQIVVPNSVLGNGGAVLSDNDYRIAGTLGQPFMSSGSNAVGFWYLASRELNVEVEQSSFEVPGEFQLQQNYPNPFNPTTTIEFALPKQSNVTLKLFDILGREVATLLDTELESGVHKINFDGKNLASGIYFYRIQAEAFLKTKKLMLLK